MAKLPTPLRDLYPRITSFPTLLAAFRKASRGKRYRPDVLTFAANLEAELFQLQHELRSFVYIPGAYRQFLVREPKPRLVSAAPFRDRVVHHALRRFARACREHRWILQADIRLYFPSIDHLALIAQLERRIFAPYSFCAGLVPAHP